MAVPETQQDAPVPQTDRTIGLTGAEAERRLRTSGANAIAETEIRWWRQWLAKFWGPVPWMLEAVIVLQGTLHRNQEALVILFLLVFNAAVSYIQERRAQDALALLRRQLQVTARVLRDGRWGRIAAAQLVPGDVVHVRAGDLVPADLQLFDGAVALDQSALTGESLAIDAGPGQSAYTGAVVRRGEASGEVTATGARTYYGRTAELVRTAGAPSHMQRTILAIVKHLVLFNVVLIVLVVAYAARHAFPLADTAVFALMLLVASVPVALPATYTLATAVASAQLARRGVLVTRLPAVEEAAAMDTLLSDKTGTLTQNALTVSEIRPLRGVAAAEVLRVASLASDDASQDPLDAAILAAHRAGGFAPPVAARVDFHPFDPSTRCSEGVYESGAGRWHALKGAMEAVVARSTVSGDVGAQAQRAEADLAANGARVLAVAGGPTGSVALIGLIGLADPPRPDAADLIAQLRSLGVRVSMATGDALETARAIGTQLGLGARVCTAGPDGLRDPEQCDIYARVLPQDKHAIVHALQQKGHVAGMTGDGVNDAPALRQAELGIAVASATDVAKAAAGVVLTDPGLSGVLTVVRTGREVHRRMLTYLLNKVIKTLQIVVFLTIGLWLTGGFVISPRLIVLLLFANDFLTMSIAIDRVRPPARPQRWRAGQLVGVASVLAAISIFFSLGLYEWACARYPLGLRQIHTMVFLLLVFTTQANVYVLRNDDRIWSFAPAPAMAWASIAAMAIVSVLAATGIGMAAIPPGLIAAMAALVAAFALILDLTKRVAFRHFRLG